MDWTEDRTASRTTFTLDADPRYMAERWGLGSWTAWFDGYRISPDDASLGSRPEAQAFAEAHFASADRRLDRLAELTEHILDEFEATVLGHYERVNLDQVDSWRKQAEELVGGQP